MNRKLARWTAGVVAAATLPVAAIVPTAASASAATLQHSATTTSATTGVWIPLENYYGAPTPVGDYVACEYSLDTYWSKKFPLTPLGDFLCYGPSYSANLGHYYTLFIYIS